MSLTGFAVDLIEYSLCNFRQLSKRPISSSQIYSLAIADTVHDRVYRWLERAFHLQRQLVSLFPFNNSQIYSLAIARHCLWRGFPLARPSILSATLGSFATSDQQSTNMLTCHHPTLSLSILSAISFSLATSESLFIGMPTCHRPTLSPTVFAVGSIWYSLYFFRHLVYLWLAIHKYAHFETPDIV